MMKVRALMLKENLFDKKEEEELLHKTILECYDLQNVKITLKSLVMVSRKILFLHCHISS